MNGGMNNFCTTLLVQGEPELLEVSYALEVVIYYEQMYFQLSLSIYIYIYIYIYCCAALRKQHTQYIYEQMYFQLSLSIYIYIYIYIAVLH